MNAPLRGWDPHNNKDTYSHAQINTDRTHVDNQNYDDLTQLQTQVTELLMSLTEYLQRVNIKWSQLSQECFDALRCFCSTFNVAPLKIYVDFKLLRHESCKLSLDLLGRLPLRRTDFKKKKKKSNIYCANHFEITPIRGAVDCVDLLASDKPTSSHLQCPKPLHFSH